MENLHLRLSHSETFCDEESSIVLRNFVHMDASCILTSVGKVQKSLDISILLDYTIVITIWIRSFKLTVIGECQKDACLSAIVLNDKTQLLLVVRAEKTEWSILPMHSGTVSGLPPC